MLKHLTKINLILYHHYKGGGNVLQEPSTDSKLPQLLQKDSILEKLQESNTTLSEDK
jgi:hypothetical protein